jgi:hypothetical protein
LSGGGQKTVGTRINRQMMADRPEVCLLLRHAPFARGVFTLFSVDCFLHGLRSVLVGSLRHRGGIPGNGRRLVLHLTNAGTMTKTMTKGLLYMCNLEHLQSANKELQPADANVSYRNSGVWRIPG